MFFKSLSILQKKEIQGSSIDFHLWLYQRPENVCKCTSIKLLTMNICNFAAGHLYTELKAGLYKTWLCFFNGMNHFLLLNILYLSTSRDSCSSGHPDLQHYVLQKPARTLGNELRGGIEDSLKVNTIKSNILLHSILNSLIVGFLLKMFFHILPKRPINGY